MSTERPAGGGERPGAAERRGNPPAAAGGSAGAVPGGPGRGGDAGQAAGDVPCRDLVEYLTLLLERLAEADPGAAARIRELVGERRARIVLDAESAIVSYDAAGRLEVVPAAGPGSVEGPGGVEGPGAAAGGAGAAREDGSAGSPGAAGPAGFGGGLVATGPGGLLAVTGSGATTRATVLDLLGAYREVTAAVLDGELEMHGTVDDVAAMGQAIEILLDAAGRAPALQALARDFQEDPCRAPVPPRAGGPRPPRTPFYPDPPTPYERELLRRLDLLP